MRFMKVFLRVSNRKSSRSSKEPTYSGEGEINEEIIEPHGIDLPTVIYKDASEAIDLSKQTPEIRDFMKRIFLEKHPEAVALHAMDSGNFSLTLGYTKLRLREGETLPRARRIFHVSPSDKDILMTYVLRFMCKIKKKSYPLTKETAYNFPIVFKHISNNYY